MRMVCPACSAAYDVPDTLMVPGRVVRCARCGHEWAPVAAEPPAAGPLPPPHQEIVPPPHWPDGEVIEEVELEPGPPLVQDPPRFTAMDRLASQRATPHGPSVGLRIAWVLSILALLALGAAAYVWRVEVMHAWPASERVYGTLGFTQTPQAKP